MSSYYCSDDPKFRETKYHQVHYHPVRFCFLTIESTGKEKDKILEYLKDQLNIKIRVKRENKKWVFMSSNISNEKAVRYCFTNLNLLMNKFNADSYEIDLTSIQNKEK